MSIVEVGPKYRLTITKAMRKRIPIKIGQKVYLLPRPPYIVIIPIPDRVDEELARLIGDIVYTRKERIKAEEQLLKEAPQ